MKIEKGKPTRLNRYSSSYIYKIPITCEDPDGDPIKAFVVFEMEAPSGFLLQYSPPAGSRAIVLAIDIPEQITIGGHQIDAETIFNNTANEQYIELIKAIEEVL